MKNMNIVLVCTVRNYAVVKSAIDRLVRELSQSQYNLVHDHVTSYSQSDMDHFTSEQRLEYFEDVVNRIRKADVVIAESSTESFSVGFLLSKAIDLGKPVTIFYNSKSSKSNVLPFLDDKEAINLIKYHSVEEFILSVYDSLSHAQQLLPTRYNIILSPEINNYLRWITRTYKRSRSEFIRDLIRQHMQLSDFSPTSDSLEANLASEPAATPAH